MTLEARDLQLPPFRNRFPWFGGDLQTIASRLPFRHETIAPANSERLEIRLRDGSGDVLLATLDRASPAGQRPLVLLVHGLTGSETSSYMLNSARWFLAHGHDVVRLNLRGAGPSRAVCGGQYHAGSSDDIWAALRELPAALVENGVVLIGFSLGGSIVLKYLDEAGSSTPVVAAATICAPLDLGGAAARLQRPRNRAYHSYILAHMKREATATGARLDEGERDAILGAQSVFEFDDRFISPRLGFADATAYHDGNSPLYFLHGIDVPTLCIAAADDPYIPVEPYEQAHALASRQVCIVVASGGGHVGFHDVADDVPWHDRAVTAFLERVL